MALKLLCTILQITRFVNIYLVLFDSESTLVIFAKQQNASHFESKIT